jgi:hypothetical protein
LVWSSNISPVLETATPDALKGVTNREAFREPEPHQPSGKCDVRIAAPTFTTPEEAGAWVKQTLKGKVA